MLKALSERPDQCVLALPRATVKLTVPPGRCRRRRSQCKQNRQGKKYCQPRLLESKNQAQPDADGGIQKEHVSRTGVATESDTNQHSFNRIIITSIARDVFGVASRKGARGVDGV